MKAGTFARKARAPRQAPRARGKAGARRYVYPEQRTEKTVNPALEAVDELRGRAGDSQGSVEDPLGDWPEGGSSGNDEWLQERDGEGPPSS
jgi:hypothetical protein